MNSVVANVIIYLSSATNYGDKTYDELYAPDVNGYQYFSFPEIQNYFTVPKGATLSAFLHWSESFFLDAQKDYKLTAIRVDNGSGLPGTDNRQDLDYLYPQEKIEWTNNTGQNQLIYFQIRGPGQGLDQGRELKMRVYTDSASGQILYPTNYGGIAGHAAAESCLSVAAVNADNIGVVASYSSPGPTPIYTFNPDGTVQSIVNRSTPSFSGVDKVQTRVGQAGWFPVNPFTGTSASAPHIAGVVALMLQVNPNLSWAQIKSNLQSTATLVTGSGGAGLVNAFEAVYSSVRTVSDTTFSTNITLNSYVRFLGTTTIQPGIVLEIPQNKTMAIEGRLVMGSIQSKLNVRGTLIMRNFTQYHGTLISRPFGGRVFSDGSVIHQELVPKNTPTMLQGIQNSQLLVYGLYQINEGKTDSVVDNSSVIVDSGGILNLLTNSELAIQSTCSLRVKGNGIVKIPSGAKLNCTGTLIVDQGGTIQVGKGGILQINGGGQMQMLAGGNGSITVDSSGQVICYGTISASDTLYMKKSGIVQIQSGGQLSLNSGGVVILDTSAQLTDYGTVTVNNGGIIDARKSVNIIIQNSGTLRTNQGGLINTVMSGGIDCYGTLSTNSTINSDGLITIRSGGKLKADSSSFFRMGYNGYVNIYGSIVARGTATKKILFTSSNPNPTKGAWNRIYLLGGPDTLKNCDIKYARYGLYISNSSTDIIDSCTVDSSQYYGIILDTDNGTNKILNTTITNNSSGLLVTSSKASIIQSSIKNNASNGIFILLSKPYISKSRIQSNGANGLLVSGSTAMPFFSPDGIDSGKNTLKLNGISNGLSQLNIGDGGNAYLGELVSYSSCICEQQSNTPVLSGIQGTGCPEGCHLETRYEKRAGYNNLYTTSTSSGALVNNNTSKLVKARYNYWYTTSQNSIVGPVDSTWQLTDSIYTPARAIPIIVEQEMSPVLNSATVTKSEPTPEDIVYWLKSLRKTVEEKPDDALLALHLLSAFVGPGGNYPDAIDTTWDDFLSSIETSSPSMQLRVLATAYKVEAKMYQHKYSDAISLSNLYLQNNKINDHFWLYFQAQKLLSYLGLGKRTDAGAILQIVQRAAQNGRYNPSTLETLNMLVNNHPINTSNDSPSNEEMPPQLQQTISQIPTSFDLDQNYPNPFNPVTTIKYALPEDSKVTIKIYNILGQVVSSLVDEYQSIGVKTVSFDAGELPSGVYFYHFQTNKFTAVKKMLLIQ